MSNADTSAPASDPTPEVEDGEQASGLAAATDEVDAGALESTEADQPQEPVEESEVGPTAPPPPPVSLDVALGAAWWFVKDKAIFGPNLRIGGRWIWFAAETNLVLVTRSTSSFEHTLLGATFGTYLEVSPLRTRQLEAHLGLGSDYHWLAAINSEEWKFAFAARASLHAWLGKHVGMFVAGRGYLAKSDGLGLGTSSGGVSQFPLLFSAGVEWRP